MGWHDIRQQHLVQSWMCPQVSDWQFEMGRGNGAFPVSIVNLNVVVQQCGMLYHRFWEQSFCCIRSWVYQLVPHWWRLFEYLHQYLILFGLSKDDVSVLVHDKHREFFFKCIWAGCVFVAGSGGLQFNAKVAHCSFK